MHAPVVVNGDCLAVMRAMEPNSVDAIVCDPPYGLEFMGKDWDKLQPRTAVGGKAVGKTMGSAPETEKGNPWASERPSYGAPKKNPRCRKCAGYKISGSKQCACEAPDWDTRQYEYARQMQAWHEDWAVEALRVAKPGAHLVAFGGTRTFHRLACAIEDAGWEIRDTLSWLYGSGFPKSLDVSKAMDKKRDDRADVRAVCEWLSVRRDESGASNETLDAACGLDSGGASASHWTAGPEYKQPRVPTWDQWLQLKALLGFGDEMDAEVWRLNGRKGQPGEAWNEREVVGEAVGTHAAEGSGLGGTAVGIKQKRIVYDVTAPATDLARQWEGWGTALKPAWEPIILARKPLSGTVAGNVAQFGTGALNIDGCRIGTDWATDPTRRGWQGGNTGAGSFYRDRTVDGPKVEPNAAGRWPANVVLDPEAAALLDAQSGKLPGGNTSARLVGVPSFTTRAADRERERQVCGYGDTGGASRFYYCAKSSRAERSAGLGDLAASHPTVKPLALMRWLCRLVTPPNGMILDPFTGSGSTGCAAVLEGFRFTGIEQSEDYCAIARRRIAHWTPVQPDLEPAA